MSGVNTTGTYRDSCERLRARPLRWLVTGSAGFIGSHLVQTLLELEQHVVGLDNFATGFRRNVESVRESVGPFAWRRHAFIEADIGDAAACQRACERVDIVLHQAALGSVPRSIDDPLRTHANNVTGFLNMLVAARDAGVKRFVYASSSSVYGDHPALPKVEHITGEPLSPYALSKVADELYARVFDRCYDVATVGLRYFNVFGPRQDPGGAYAAVIPRFVAAMLRGAAVTIFGDGETTRDFCYIANVVEANILAATVEDPEVVGRVYNVAVGERISLNQLHGVVRELILQRHPQFTIPGPLYGDFRAGDVRHSEADIGLARRLLGYDPAWDVRRGLAEALPWYEEHAANEQSISNGSLRQAV